MEMEQLFSIVQGLTVESPEPLVILLALAGVVLMVGAVNRRRKGPAIVGGGLWLVAIALLIISPLVVTQRERIIKATAQLVQATAEPVNMTTLRRILDPDVQLIGPEGGQWLDSDQLFGALEHALKRWPVQQQVVDVSQIFVRGKQAIQNLQIKSNLDGEVYSSIGNITQWHLTWRQQADGTWQVQKIQWLEWMGKKPSKGLWQ